MLNGKPCLRIKGQLCSVSCSSIRSMLIEPIVPRTAPVLPVYGQLECGRRGPYQPPQDQRMMIGGIIEYKIILPLLNI
jgi:hypothetical protein